MNDSNITDAELIQLSRPGIYAITHIASGRQYIGQTFNISHRWSQHRCDLRRNRHPTDYLQHAWNKYGADAFVFSVLEYVEPGDDLLERLYEREQHWIDARGPQVYNSRPAARSMLGYRHTSETRERMRLLRAQENMSEEVRAHKKAAAQLRTSAHPTWRASISAAKAGQKWTERQRAVWRAKQGQPLTKSEQERQKRWRERGLELARSGVRSRKQREALLRLQARLRGTPWTEKARLSGEARIAALIEHNHLKSATAQVLGEAIIRSFDELTESHGVSLSIWQRVQMVAAEHAISYSVVYEWLRTRHPGLIVSQADKGETTRQRVLAAVRNFESQGGEPQHISLRELAQMVAPMVGVTSAGAERIITRLHHDGTLPPTDYVQPHPVGWRHSPEARAKMSTAMRASRQRRKSANQPFLFADEP